MIMITTKWVSAVLVAGLLVFAGCSKSDKNSAQAGSARMELPKFLQVFPSPTPEQQGNLSKVSNGVRYRLYPEALAALEAIASDPALNESQKKAVADMIAGITQTMTNAPPATAQ